MRVYTIIINVFVTLLGLVQPLAAQSRAGRPAADPEMTTARTTSADADVRRLLGLSASLSGGDRDTLGLLVSAVVADGPADAAGIDQGNRLGEINGVSLRVDPADVGQQETEDVVLRRLARALRAVRPGSDVALRVFGAGRYRAVTLQAPAASTITASVGGVANPATLAGDAAPDAALSDVIATLGQAQSQLRRLALGDRSGGTARESVPGLRVSPVGDELAIYFGEGSELGLLVLQADATWDPIRTGDVILRIDGVAADLDGLRDALSPRRRVRVELLRRKRQVTITLHARE